MTELGEPSCRAGSIPQGCPSSMVFFVALYVPWCRHLEVILGVNPQLYADILKCSAERLGALFDAARFTAWYVRAVGQDVSPGKCVLPSTSKSVRRAIDFGMSPGTASFGRFSWISGILVVILILPGGLGLVLFLSGFGKRLLV